MAVATMLGEYSSLLQLGFGIGIGLSVFRAPMDLMSKKLKSNLDSELGVYEKIETPRAAMQRASLSDLLIEFRQVALQLDKIHLPFMIASISFAVVNWALLALAAYYSHYELSDTQEWLLLIVSGPIFFLISIVLAVCTVCILKPVRERLDNLRSS